MKTVEYYRNLGLVFVNGDYTLESDGSSNRGDSSFDVDWYFNQESAFYDSEIESFAWRNNDGVKPEYKGVIEFVLNGGQKCTDYVSEITWIRGLSYSVAKWRPVVLQSDDAKDSKDESFTLPIGIDSPELRGAFKSLKEHLENKPPFWNKSVPSFSCPCVAVNIKAIKPTVSPKEDKPMKPVYTAEMHDKGELPPVGADCILIIDSEPRQARVTYIGKSLGVCSNIDGSAEYAFLLGKASFKPIIKTIKVNGFDVPAPMSEAPMIGDEYFTPQTGYEVFYCKNSWRGDKFDSRFLSRGLIHSTESAAIAHAKAMLGINPNPARGGDGYDRNVLGQNNEGDEI